MPVSEVARGMQMEKKDTAITPRGQRKLSAKERRTGLIKGQSPSSDRSPSVAQPSFRMTAASLLRSSCQAFQPVRHHLVLLGYESPAGEKKCQTWRDTHPRPRHSRHGSACVKDFGGTRLRVRGQVVYVWGETWSNHLRTRRGQHGKRHQHLVVPGL